MSVIGDNRGGGGGEGGSEHSSLCKYYIRKKVSSQMFKVYNYF